MKSVSVKIHFSRKWSVGQSYWLECRLAHLESPKWIYMYNHSIESTFKKSWQDAASIFEQTEQICQVSNSVEILYFYFYVWNSVNFVRYIQVWTRHNESFIDAV